MGLKHGHTFEQIGDLEEELCVEASRGAQPAAQTERRRWEQAVQ